MRAKAPVKKGSNAARPGALPKEEKVTGLTPAIPFCEPKKDEDIEPDRVNIKLRLIETAAAKRTSRLSHSTGSIRLRTKD